MPDLTSRKSETDADRRRNEQQFAALAKGLANVENMGERERQIFDQIAASRPSSKGPRHRAASDIFDVPLYGATPDQALRQLGERMARERDERVMGDVFGYASSREGLMDDAFWSGTNAGTVPEGWENLGNANPFADNVIDAPFRVIPPETEYERWQREAKKILSQRPAGMTLADTVEFGMPPTIASDALRSSYSNSRSPVTDAPMIVDQNPGIDGTA